MTSTKGKKAKDIPLRVSIQDSHKKSSLLSNCENDEDLPLFQEEDFETDLTDETEVIDPQILNHELYIPRHQENPTIKGLKAGQYYLKPINKLAHKIKCPWQAAHSSAESEECATYIEPTLKFPRGQFICHDDHCQERNITNLCEHLDVSSEDARNRSKIRYIPGCYNEIVNFLELELVSVGIFYVHGGFIVQVSIDPVNGEGIITRVSQQSLFLFLCFWVVFEKFDKRSRKWVCCDLPEKIIRSLLYKGNYSHLKTMMAVARQPYLRPDGSLCNSVGYDSDTKLLGVFQPYKYPLRHSPSEFDAQIAISYLLGLLREFRFKTEHDRSAALCAMLTAAIRPSLPFAPMFHICAPQMSTGKSYLCKLICFFATAMTIAATSFPASDSDCRKLLLSLLANSPPCNKLR